jgi:hypothetical protein
MVASLAVHWADGRVAGSAASSVVLSVVLSVEWSEYAMVARTVGAKAVLRVVL